MIDLIGLYESLLPASIGGVPFAIIDSSQEIGRRIQRFLFPGIDMPSYQDLGVQDGAISIHGVLAGDDYVEQARRLRNAFRTPGPLSLIHPWAEPLQVVLAGPASINFADKSLRCARFEAKFWVYQTPNPPEPDTLSALLGRAESTISDAEAWMAQVLAPAVMPLAAFAYAQSWLRSLSVGFSALINTGPSGSAIGPAAAPAVASLSMTAATPAASWATEAAAAVVAVPAAIAAAAQPVQPSAVAPGGAFSAVAAAAPSDATVMLLASSELATASAVNPSPGPALGAALQAVILANAVQAASTIAYASVQDAEAQGRVLMAALGAGISSAALQATAAPAAASIVWRDLVALKSALAADLNAVIGRLPSVVTVTTTSAVPAWLIAHYVSGDSPSGMFGTWQDLLARNAIRQPGSVPAGALEVLAA